MAQRKVGAEALERLCKIYWRPVYALIQWKALPALSVLEAVKATASGPAQFVDQTWSSDSSEKSPKRPSGGEALPASKSFKSPSTTTTLLNTIKTQSHLPGRPRQPPFEKSGKQPFLNVIISQDTSSPPQLPGDAEKAWAVADRNGRGIVRCHSAPTGAGSQSS